jgi:hypothetical protein
VSSKGEEVWESFPKNNYFGNDIRNPRVSKTIAKGRDQPYWNNTEHVKAFLESFAKDHSISKLEDWYNVRNISLLFKMLCRCQCLKYERLVVQRFYENMVDSLEVFIISLHLFIDSLVLQTVYPEFEWIEPVNGFWLESTDHRTLLNQYP